MEPLGRSQIIMIAVGVVILLLILGVATGIVPGLRQESEQIPRLTLTMWGIDDPAFFQEGIAAYKVFRPGINISYQKVSLETYERDLINALASNRAPDIIMFHRSWLFKHGDKVAPAGLDQINLKTLKELFPSAVEKDFTYDGFVYGLPLYMDSLAVLYNRDLFDKQGIALPPKDWLEFQNLIPKLRQKSESGELVRPAAAIGGSNDTIHNASDLLMLLMLQAGAKMTNEDLTEATFAQAVGEKDPAEDTMDFYLKFSDSSNTYYTWDDDTRFSLDSFAKGETAMILDYNETRKLLKSQNPFLNFEVGPMPQPTNIKDDKAVNFADYWGLAVTHSSPNLKWAWDAVKYLTTDPGASENYLFASDRPPALRSLIDQYIDHPELGVFAKQALSAQSWAEVDKDRIAGIFSDMIKAILRDQLPVSVALRQGEDEVTALMRQRQ